MNAAEEEQKSQQTDEASANLGLAFCDGDHVKLEKISD